MKRNGYGSNVSTLWLLLLRAQRPMRQGEIVKELSELPTGRVSTSIYFAYRFGYVERSGTEKKYEYSVTPRCNVPPGVRVLEVLEATA